LKETRKLWFSFVSVDEREKTNVSGGDVVSLAYLRRLKTGGVFLNNSVSFDRRKSIARVSRSADRFKALLDEFVCGVHF